MVKLLGAVDLLGGLALFSIMGEVIHVGAFSIIIVLLLLKASISFFDIGGIIDVFVSLLIFSSLYFILPPFLMTIGAVFILIKGLISLAS